MLEPLETEARVIAALRQKNDDWAQLQRETMDELIRINNEYTRLVDSLMLAFCFFAGFTIVSFWM